MESPGALNTRAINSRIGTGCDPFGAASKRTWFYNVMNSNVARCEIVNDLPLSANLKTVA